MPALSIHLRKDFCNNFRKTAKKTAGLTNLFYNEAYAVLEREYVKHVVVRWSFGVVVLLSFLLRIAAVLLAVRYMGLSYDLPEVYHSLLSFVRMMMPNLLWCVAWWVVLPVFQRYLSNLPML